MNKLQDRPLGMRKDSLQAAVGLVRNLLRMPTILNS